MNKISKKAKALILWPIRIYRSIKRHIAFRKRIKEMRKKDPFNYK